MVNAISGSGTPYAPTATAPSPDTTSAAANPADGATPPPTSTAPRVNVPEDPSTWTWEHRQEVATIWVDTSLNALATAAYFAKDGTDKVIERESNASREAGESEESISSYIEFMRDGARRAEESLASAKEILEQRGFKVTGTVYEKGSDGEWHMGQFTLDAKRDGYVLHYDSSTGLTVTPDTGTTGGGPAAATDTAKAAAMVKAADVKDIYDRAQTQVDQYRKLFDKVLVAADRLREASYNDPQAEADLTAARKEVSDFQFDPWDERLRAVGVNLGQPLVRRDSSGLPVIGARMMNTVVDGLNLNLQFDGKGGAWYRHEGSDGWQEWDDQKVADARTLLQQALTQPVDLKV